MAITWKNIAAPDLQTNFNKVDLGGGFSKIGEYLSTIGENQRVKEKEDITNTLISDLTRYTGKDGEESLGALRSSGGLADTLTALGNKVDSKAVMGALLSSQDRLAQENQRIQATQEKDRLLSQKPYVDVTDTLIAQGNLEGARNYVTTLAGNGNIDNDISAKIFHAARKAEEDATQTKRNADTFNLNQAAGKLRLEEAQREVNTNKTAAELIKQWDTVASKPKPGELVPINENTPERKKLQDNEFSNVANEFIAKYKLPVTPDGLPDRAKWPEAIDQEFATTVKDRLSALKAPKPDTSTISDRTQAFKQMLIDQGVPTEAIIKFDDLLQKRLAAGNPKLFGEDAAKAEQTQRKAANAEAKLKAIAEDQKRSLERNNLSGNTVSEADGQEAVIKQLKALGMASDSKDGDAQDRYSYIMEIVSDPEYSNIDSKVVNSIINKVVGKRAGSWDIFNWDSGYQDDIKKELNAYKETNKFKQDNALLLISRDTVKEASDTFLTNRLVAEQIKPSKTK